MKALIFILVMLGFYYGINRYGMSEAPFERWVSETQFPSPKASDKFCAALSPNAVVAYETHANGQPATRSINSASALCQHWREYAQSWAKIEHSRTTISDLKITRDNHFPYNAATANFRVMFELFHGRNSTYVYTRDEQLHFKRGFLGDFSITAFSGTENIDIPQTKTYHTTVGY